MMIKIVQVLILGYAPLVFNLLQFFQCKELEDGSNVILLAPYVNCFSDEYNQVNLTTLRAAVILMPMTPSCVNLATQGCLAAARGLSLVV